METPAHFWHPFEKRISTFDELVAVINNITQRSISNNLQFAWRGHVNSNWSLHSSLYRRSIIGKSPINEMDFQKIEKSILIELHRWGLHSPPSHGRLSILNQLAMLQHYGSPTRLIDITFNAWVGVWFAVEEKWNNGELVNDDVDGRLFAIDITKRIINENDTFRKWEDSLSRPWKPSNLDSRIFAQNGGFLFGGVPSTARPHGSPLQFPKSTNNSDGYWPINDVRRATSVAIRPHSYSATSGRVSDNALYTFVIDSSIKRYIRDFLKRSFGYQHSTIYPDYTGFASFGTPKIKSH
ncbi:MAG: FRG domain-containing protein [Leptothrix ochracea]|uniref:FRG domain-containing protein n=1 Tax=Leptothrix ochracea TaxID=735331 RepID=UPI0034E20A32